MKAIKYDGKDDFGPKKETETSITEMQHCAERIWNAISKYVAFDKDGIFKDPNWPHLWDKK